MPAQPPIAHHRSIVAALLIAVLGLVGCSGKDQLALDELLEQTERELYQAAQRSLRASNFPDAIGRLQQLESRFPFGRYAEQAQLELIYAYYRSSQTESARSAADRFLRLHPGHPSADYALYLKAMASFEQDANILDRFLPGDTAKRDPGAARDSFDDFADLLRRYPDSQYAPDAHQRMVYLRNLLADYELNVARYYIRREAYVAAANRGQYIFEHYQESPAVPDSLAIMVEAYRNLGMQTQADEVLKVLVGNYPDHPALNKNGEFRFGRQPGARRSWLNIVTFGLAG